MDLKDAMHIAAAGMKVQGTRMRLVAQNLANAESTALQPGGEPYRRQTITFENQLNRELGIETVAVARTGTDPSPFEKRFEPGHPAADAEGYVLTPNLDPLLEMMDLREAQRSFEANLNAMTLARTMIQRTIDLLR
ncbi:MAG: flagellar basal body rod protein FlgC [Geminicoccaceae bacterium]|nr:flagellar basal body rod protein FlgC [Geminicoccaceae bacterium]